MGKRSTRAEQAIDEVKERAERSLDVLMEGVDGARDAAGRRARKSRKRIDKARKEIEGAVADGERRLRRGWNRGRLRVRRIRRKTTRHINRAVKSAHTRIDERG